MDINYKWYKKDIFYDKQNICRSEILKYILTNDVSKYDDILKYDKRVDVFKALSKIRENIINWYPISKDASVLEIGGGFGELTNTLCNKANNVVSISFSKENAEAIYKRCSDISNLEIICSSIEDCKLVEKFDYITLFGILEFSHNIILEKENPKDCIYDILKFAHEHLKPNGKILIATDNKFGVKYFGGAKYSPQYNAFSNITNQLNSENPKTYSKYELEEIFNNIGIHDYKFYYPLPDYTLANVIYSEQFLPKVDSSKIMYNVYYNEYEKIFFNEHHAIKELIKSKQFENFSNSFFVEVGKEKSPIKFVGFNNMRKEKYRLVTKIYDNYVEKDKINQSGNYQINQISNNINILKSLKFSLLDKIVENKVISRYVNSETLDSNIANKIINSKLDEGILEIEKWYKYVFNKLYQEDCIYTENIFTEFGITIDSDQLNRLHFTAHGFIDLVLENTFLIGNEYFFYDQEWYKKNIPIEFLLYRAIHNFYFYNPEISKKLKKDDMFIRFNIFEYIDIFKDLEEKWQIELSDMDIVTFYSNTYKNITDIEALQNDIYTIEKDADMYKKENLFLKKELENVNMINNININKIEQLEKKITMIVSSRSWRYTKLLRRKKSWDDLQK